MLQVRTYRLLRGLSGKVLCGLFFAFAFALAAQSATVIIDHDTTIDASNSYPNDHVEITDGISGPTFVSMTDGGVVRGFGVNGSSAFEIEGGASTFLSSTSGSSSLVLRGGEIGCTAAACQTIDYDAVLHIDDASSLHLFGGTIDGPIALEPGATSMAVIYGTDLSITALPERGLVTVEGTLEDGQTHSYSFSYVPDYASRIVLNEVPEPSSIAIAMFSLLPAFLRRLKHTH